MRQPLTCVLPAILFALCCPTLWAQQPQPDPEPAPDRIQLQIGKDTTFFTGPLTDDGTIDYVAALNQHYGKDIKAEDNAYALLVQVLLKEPKPDWDEEQVIYRDRLFETLGIKPDPNIPSFLTLDDYVAQVGLEEPIADMINRATQSPWTKEDLPHIHAWIQANATAMEQIDKALQRPRYYAPLIEVKDNEPLPSILLPQLIYLREAGRLIRVRGMYAIAQGNYDAALKEAIRLQQFGKLVSNGPTAISVLVGVSLQVQQNKLLETLSELETISEDKAKQYIKAYQQIGSVDNIITALNHTDRTQTLDMIQRAWTGSETSIQFILGNDDPDSNSTAQRIGLLVRSPLFDINHSLRSVNERYDKLALISNIADIQKRHEAIDAFDASFDTGDTSPLTFINLLGMASTGRLPDGWTTKRYTDEVTHLCQSMLFPLLRVSTRTEKRAHTRRLIQATAIALLGYRDRHGQLPQSLDALVPTYFETTPTDPYTDKPLIYRINGNGSALVYSLGDNFQDDGGVDDYSDGDIAIRIGSPQ